MGQPVDDKASQKETDTTEAQDEYVRVRSAPPQTALLDEPEQLFQLCNMDGTPLVFDLEGEGGEDTSKPRDEQRMEEEIRKVMDGVKEVSITEKIVEVDAIEDEVSSKCDKVEEKRAPSGGTYNQVRFFAPIESEDMCIEISEFEKFLQIEELISQYPTLNIDYIKARIHAMLSDTRRKEIPIDFIYPKSVTTVMDKLKSLKEKEDTVIQKVRNEFNRVTAENFSDVVENLREIRVEKVSEMQEIAGFVLEKAITEKVYLNTYAFIIGKLKKEWKCEEEKSMTDRKQTCFFGTLLKFLLARINTRHTWAQELDINTIEVTDRAKLEEIIEDYESSRLKRKNMAIGCIDLMTTLYLQNTIGPSTLVTVCDYFSSSDTPENVELVAKLLKSVAEKFADNDKLEVVVSTYNYLARNLKKHGLRVEYLVESTMKYVSANVPAVRTKVGVSTKNSFASLATSSSEEDDESQYVQEFVYDVSSRIQKIESTEEKEDLSNEIISFVNEHPAANRLFFMSYIVELVTNSKSKDALIELLITKLYSYATDFIGSLNDVKAEYAMLKIDFPRSPRYFSEFISILRAADLLSADDFENLKPQNFAQLASELMKRWEASKDERLRKAFTSDELKVLQQ